MRVGLFLQISRSFSGILARGPAGEGPGSTLSSSSSPLPPTPSTPAPALEVLRTATAPKHAAIEQLLGLRGPFGLPHYGRVLQGFGAFLAAWEPRMARTLGRTPVRDFFARGRRVDLVQWDLRMLELPGVADARAFVPALPGVPEALGSLYVLEGSALGGQFIASRAQRLLGLTPERGAAYFHGCGSGTAARWREFQAIAAGQLDGDEDACSRAAAAAVQTFEGLIALFEDLLHERAVA